MSPPTSQNIEEFDDLLTIYSLMSPMRSLEIGTHEGGTLFYWLKYAPQGAVVGSIDIQGIITNAQAAEWAAENVTALCLKADSTTNEAVKWADFNFQQLDWLFIDGGHDYETVKSDWENYSGLVKEGGVIAFHDILPQENSEVDKLWKEIKNNFYTVEIIYPHEEWGHGPGIGVIYL